MARLTNFSDFVGGNRSYNSHKPYIYVIKYIMSKENYVDELKEYILNYEDEESDYEDEDTFDSFMRKLKFYANENDIDEIEEMIINYEEFEDEEDFDSDDDNYEERMFDKEYAKDSDVFENEKDVVLDYIETHEDDIDHESIKIEDSDLNDKLKDFLKVDIKFEDLEDSSLEDIESEFDKSIEDIDFEEIVNEEDKKPTWNDETFDVKEEEEEELKDEHSKGYLDVEPTNV